MWTATHRITFLPHGGGPAEELASPSEQWLVMLCKDPYSQDYLVAPTEVEWQKERPPVWQCRKSDSAWLWCGMTTPQRRRGRVQVDALAQDEQRPITLRYTRSSSSSGDRSATALPPPAV